MDACAHACVHASVPANGVGDGDANKMGMGMSG